MSGAGHRPGLRVAVLGHAQHGKTALVAALEERSLERAGFMVMANPPPPRPPGAPPLPPGPTLRKMTFNTVERDYAAVDVTARPRFLRQAGVAASAVDACLLVVSAVEGVMPQTREHALLARQLSPGALVVFINRCDEVTDVEQLDLAEVETRDALFDTGFDGDTVTVVRGSARPLGWMQSRAWESALDALLDALDRGLSDVARDAGGPLWATVLRRWTRASTTGPVVEVSVRQGAVDSGDRVVVVGRNGQRRGARVEQRRAFSGPRLAAGDIGTVSLRFDAPLLRNERFPRLGDVIQADDLVTAAAPLRVRLRLLDAASGGRRTPMRTGHRAAVWMGGRYASCRVSLASEVWSMAPGEERDDVVLDVVGPVLAPPGTTFVLRGGSDEFGAVFSGRWGGCFATGEVIAPGPWALRLGVREELFLADRAAEAARRGATARRR